jgi:hypothetical protein
MFLNDEKTSDTARIDSGVAAEPNLLLETNRTTAGPIQMTPAAIKQLAIAIYETAHSIVGFNSSARLRVMTGNILVIKALEKNSKKVIKA